MRVKTTDPEQMLTFIRCNAIDPDILDDAYKDLKSECGKCFCGPRKIGSWEYCAKHGVSLCHNVLRWVVDGDVSKIPYLYSKTGCYREESFDMDMPLAKKEYQYIKDILLKKYSEGNFYGTEIV